MKKLTLKLTPALLFGLSLTLSLLGLMTYLHTETVHAAGPHHVAPSCAGVPAPCYTTVQAAVDAAVSGDVIMVAAGTYTGVTSRAGVTQTVYISKSVTIRGGYTTAFTEPPDPQTNPTTLDAQGQGRVMYIIGNITPTIEGLRITGGIDTGSGGGISIFTSTAILSNNYVFSNTAYIGGGIFLHQSSAILDKNTVVSNTANYGGGILLEVSPATLNSNEIKANMSSEGGGLYLVYSQAKLDNNNIVANTAFTYGGGLSLWFSDSILSQNIISGNRTIAGFGFGGGAYVMTATTTFRNNLFSNNRAYLGGGMYLNSSPAKLQGNTIISNTGDYGGGIVLEFSNTLFENNIVADNLAHGLGSGLYFVASSPRLWHTTIVQNKGGERSGVRVEGWPGNWSTPVFTNTIILSHTTGITVTAGNTVTLTNILAHGNSNDGGGGGFITATQIYTGNPAFVNPAGGDYHLAPTSAAIDKGINAGVATDIDGQPRPQGAGFDLGADEYSAPLVPLTGVTINGPLTGALNESYPFSATFTPTTATPPVTYTWAPAPESGQGTASVTYTWAVTGAKTITVTAAHAGGVVTDTHLIGINAPALSLRKSGPTTAAPGNLITYTLTVTNSGNLTATNLIITDTIPPNATYINGGTKVGNVVSWTIPSLAASGGVTQTTFVVTATQTITNSDYGVRADGGYPAQGSVAVVTAINAQAPESKVFVPVILKQ